MAMDEGYNEYACDVRSCGKREYAKPNSDQADGFVTRRRYDDKGVLREVMICVEHNEAYARLVGECEKAFQAFEFDGSYTLATQEEVDQLNAQLEQLQADYDAMRRNRDTWVTKYNQLNAEFEEYKRTHPDEGSEE